MLLVSRDPSLNCGLLWVGCLEVGEVFALRGFCCRLQVKGRCFTFDYTADGFGRGEGWGRLGV